MVAWLLNACPSEWASAELVWKSPKSKASQRLDGECPSSTQVSDSRPADAVATDEPAGPGRAPGLTWKRDAYPVRQTSVHESDARVSIREPALTAPEVIPAPEGVGPDQVSSDARMFAPRFPASAEGPLEPMPGGEYGQPCDTCAPCDACTPWRDGEGGCGFGPCDLVCRVLGRMSFFGGIHGFKGPVDVGQNGNFGFHEGLNFGAPLGDPWGYGFQLGFQAVHSNFSGFQIDAPNNAAVAASQTRRQFFFTGGLFRRVDAGFQWGAVFDYVHDTYYDQTDLRQVRSETAFVFGEGCHELGYWGAYGVNVDRFRLPAGNYVFLQPNDVFAGFYRRHFSGGGQGRLWGGATGMGQAIIGGEATVPLGTNWALENNFVYVIPKNSAANGGQREETWSVTISLVWYPGRPARTVFSDRYQPLLGVGDNSALLIRR